MLVTTDDTVAQRIYFFWLCPKSEATQTVTSSTLCSLDKCEASRAIAQFSSRAFPSMSTHEASQQLKNSLPGAELNTMDIPVTRIDQQSLRVNGKLSKMSVGLEAVLRKTVVYGMEVVRCRVNPLSSPGSCFSALLHPFNTT